MTTKKLNYIALKFTDVDGENARLEIITDPPTISDEDVGVMEQPCFTLAYQCISYLNAIREKEASTSNGQAHDGELVDVDSGQTIH